ncbi:universal stress protein [Nonomuraea indica]|uniref:universal stress protein n=1 Tax=Nonomuraea indica TaxID=1581193 RepID=UPI000C7E2A54|nr:universal stress protein [Nonomuraea indica]
MGGRIVVGVDGSVSATAAVEWAAADARRRGLGLRIVHVCEQWAATMAAGEAAADYCAGALEAAADHARELAPGVEVSTGMLSGGVIDALIRESTAAESVVVGSRGLGGFAGMLLGSVGLNLAGHAAGPVVVVRGPSVVQHGQVVVGYDGSEHSTAAMEYAVEQARSRDAQLYVLTAWQMPMFSPYAAAYSDLLQEAYEEEVRMARAWVVPWRERHPDVRIVDEQVSEHPVSALVKASASADLVVVGSHGRGGFASAVLGSVSHGVLHHVTCPVAVVRPREDGRQGPPRGADEAPESGAEAARGSGAEQPPADGGEETRGRP